MHSSWCAISTSAVYRGARRLASIAPIVFGLSVLGIASSAEASKSVAAASGQYHLYVDADANAATGCSANFTDARGQVTQDGYEQRLSFSVDTDGNTSALSLASCQSGAFGASSPIGQIATQAPVVNVGKFQMAQVELSVPLASLGATLNSVIAVAAPGDYILTRQPGASQPATLTPNASVTPPTAAPLAVPALSPVLLLALVGLLFLAGWRWGKRLPQLAWLGVICLVTAGSLNSNTIAHRCRHLGLDRLSTCGHGHGGRPSHGYS